MRRVFGPRSLSMQIVISFVGLVLLTVIAAGLPSFWLISDQLERRAWAQVEQGRRTTQALYAAQQSEVVNLALLTAQRPTLAELLSRGDQVALRSYLLTLQSGMGLDAILVCSPDAQPVARVGSGALDSVCKAGAATGFFVAGETSPQVWLFAANPIGDAEVESSASVVVGLALDDDFSAQMRAQTGLDHTLLLDGQPLVTSLAGGISTRQAGSSSPADGRSGQVLILAGVPYYATRISLDGPGLQAEVALAVTDIATAQKNLGWALGGGILLVAVAGSMVGVILARRISRPLARLTQSATALSLGDLSSSIAVESGVREVALVAQALDRARLDLQHTLSELRREKAWTDHLLESIVEGIVTLNQSGRITFFSSGAERITGWSRDEVLGRSCDEVFQPLELAQSFSQFIPSPGRRRKVTVKLANGDHATLAVTGARLVPPETDDARVALVFRDVSEEEVIHRLVGHFLANVSHEFRTPLSALAASVELLLDQASDLTPDELQELLTSLHLGILGLQTLVDNLLESASIEAGRFQVHARPTNLGKIIAEAVCVMQPLLDKHGQRLVMELPATIPLVLADSRRTVQVLVNLLSNAGKYGPDDAEITIGATTSDKWVRVAVADRGPGVGPEHKTDLFRRFVHLDSEDDKAQYGAGLGLSVVKAVVEAQGGQVGVEDRPGGGAVFWFTVPVEGGP